MTICRGILVDRERARRGYPLAISMVNAKSVDIITSIT